MTTDLSAPVQKIAEKIQSEEQLVGKMLKIVNSPFYGLGESVKDVSTARLAHRIQEDL